MTKGGSARRPAAHDAAACGGLTGLEPGQVQAALAGFKTSRNSFLALIDAERNLRTVELKYAGAVTDFHRRSAELDRAVGRLPTGLSGQRLESPVFSLISNDRGDLP